MCHAKILSDRSLRHPGAKSTHHGRNAADLRHKRIGWKERPIRVVWEIAATAEFKKLTSGGTAADGKTCAQGYISHMVTSSENRWCIPEHLLQLTALWVSDGCLGALPCTNASLKL